MKVVALIQAKNEGLDNLRELLKQAEIMSDGVIILDDHSTDDSFPDEIKKHPLVLEYYRFPVDKDFYEGINMSILINLARKYKADWCYFPGGHYRFAGELSKFKDMIKELDAEGVTDINMRWFTYWDDKRVRIDNKFYAPQRYYTVGFKVQDDTYFDLKQAHCSRPISYFEVHALLNDVISLNYGRNTPEKRQRKYDTYSKMEGLHPLDYVSFESYIEKVPEEELREYSIEDMIKLSNELNKHMTLRWVILNNNFYIPREYVIKRVHNV